VFGVRLRIFCGGVFWVLGLCFWVLFSFSSKPSKCFFYATLGVLGSCFRECWRVVGGGLMEAAVCVFCVRVTGGEVSILSSTVIISFRYIRCGGYGFLLSRGSLLAKCFVCRD